jgi:N-acetylglutamate synthase-like GNAT family acetyltransferase
MIRVRPATAADAPRIVKILDEADLRYQQETFNGFLLAEKAGEVTGVVRLEEHPDFIFLTSLGVAAAHQHQGVATALLNYVLQAVRQPIYLYTVIPDFFRRFGFRETIPLPGLPDKTIYGCNACFPGQCVVMVK